MAATVHTPQFKNPQIMNEDDVRKVNECFEKRSGAKVPPPRRSARSSDKANNTSPPKTEGFAQAGNNGSDQTNQWPEPQPLEDFLFPVCQCVGKCSLIRWLYGCAT